MGLRHHSRPHRDIGDPTPGNPQNFSVYAASSTVFVLSWVANVNRPLPTDYDLDYSTVSGVGPWTPIPYNLGTSYNHTGQDVTVQHWYRLVAKNGGSYSNSVIATAIAYCPVFTVAPPSHTSPAAGDTIQFTATDVDDPPLTYSLAFKYRSDIFINPSTGLVTVPATAAGTNGNITVRCTDNIGLYQETTCAVNVLGGATYYIPTSIASRVFNAASATGFGGTNATNGSAWVTTGGVTRLPIAGDIIEFRPGTHGQIKFLAVIGTASSRITIRGPQTGTTIATIRRDAPAQGGFIVEFTNCHYFNFDGESSASAAVRSCGIKVTYATKAASTVGGVTYGTDNPSMWIKHTGGSAASVITSDNCTHRYIYIDGGYPTYSNNGSGFFPVDLTYLRSSYSGQWVENMVFEYNYCRRLFAGGFYLGPNWSNNTAGTISEGIPHRNMIARYNRVEDCSVGINCKMWWEGDNRVHDNVILRVGGKLDRTANERSAINMFWGTVKIYNNYIEDVGAKSSQAVDPAIPHGIWCGIATGYNGTGPTPGHTEPGYTTDFDSWRLDIYNNVVAGVARTGINLNATSGLTRWLPYIYNNTVYDTGNATDAGASAYSAYAIQCDGASGGFVRNNICLNFRTAAFSSSASAIAPSGGNRITGTVPFVNSVEGSYNFQLSTAVPVWASSVLGTDVPVDSLTHTNGSDIANVSRTSVASADMGAYEKA